MSTAWTSDPPPISLLFERILMDVFLIIVILLATVTLASLLCLIFMWDGGDDG